MRKARAVLMLVAVSTAVACVPRREPAPPVPQREPTLPPPVRTPPPPPPAADWRDVPLTPGGWTYRAEGQGSVALFGAASVGAAAFIVRCDRARRQITLSREGTSTGNFMTVRTSSAARNFPFSVQAEPAAYVSAWLVASDRFLDGMAFSRGRFTVEVPGTPMLVIPAWPEPARVVEDCRS